MNWLTLFSRNNELFINILLSLLAIIQLRSFLSNRASNSAALSFSLVVHNDSCVILTVKEGSVRSVPSSSLSYYNSGVHFLSEFLDSLLDRAEHYVADGTGGQSVEVASNALAGDDEEILSA